MFNLGRFGMLGTRRMGLLGTAGYFAWRNRAAIKSWLGSRRSGVSGTNSMTDSFEGRSGHDIGTSSGRDFESR